MIFNAFSKALGQFGDPRFRGVVLRGVGLSLALLFALFLLLQFLISWLVGATVTLPLIGEVSWVGSALSVGAFFLMMALSVVLMVPVASAIASMFLDEVADAVEDVHYPHLPDVPGLSLWEGIKDGVNFLGVVVAANAMALVLYLIFSPLAPFIFWGLNGFLLGREYFTLAAARRVGRAEAKRLRRRYMPTIWTAGVLMALPLSVPLLNLLIPVLGAATFTHIYHMLPERAPAPI